MYGQIKYKIYAQHIIHTYMYIIYVDNILYYHNYIIIYNIYLYIYIQGQCNPPYRSRTKLTNNKHIIL